MEYFRWILVVIGLLILLGIFLFANPDRKRSMTRRAARGHGDADGEEKRATGMDSATDIYLARQQAIDGLQGADSESDNQSTAASSARRSENTHRPGAATEAPQTGDQPPGLEADRVLTLYVIAERRAPIAGVELLEAALKAGLTFGERKIYHRLHQETGEPVFSMADLTAPGDFDPTAWNLFETRGVTLFMTLPGPLGAMNGWDTMLAGAERLASLLSARIVDSKREPLTRQKVALIREQMRQFDRKQTDSPSTGP